MSNAERTVEKVAHRPQLVPGPDKVKLGLWLFLGSEVVLFGALIFMYALVRITYAQNLASFRAQLNVPLVAANTLVLIASSYVVAQALDAAKQGKPDLVRTLLALAVVLGTTFLGGQAWEWTTLLGSGIRLDSTFGAPFFIVTGLHGAHVLGGLCWAALLLLSGARHHMCSNQTESVEMFGLYWHLVDIVWVILFSVLYLL